MSKKIMQTVITPDADIELNGNCFSFFKYIVIALNSSKHYTHLIQLYKGFN